MDRSFIRCRLALSRLMKFDFFCKASFFAKFWNFCVASIT